jgi:hypothetical protein
MGKPKLDKMMQAVSTRWGEEPEEFIGNGVRAGCLMEREVV